MAVTEITADELADRIAAGEPLFDVRRPDEYESGHVPGAVLIPLDEVPSRVDEFPADKEFLVICRSGGRSRRGRRRLRSLRSGGRGRSCRHGGSGRRRGLAAGGHGAEHRRLRGGAGLIEHLDRRSADLDRVAGPQRLRLGDLLAVHERAVRGPEVLDRQLDAGPP